MILPWIDRGVNSVHRSSSAKSSAGCTRDWRRGIRRQRCGNGGHKEVPGIALGWVTWCHAWRVHGRARVYAFLRDLYLRDILFSRCAITRRGGGVQSAQCSFCTSHPPALVLVFALFSPPCFAVPRVGVIVLRYIPPISPRMAVSQTSTWPRATDSGTNMIIFRNLLSRCSLLWDRRRRCRATPSPGVYFPDRPHRSPSVPEIAVFYLRSYEFFCARNRVIVKSSCPRTRANMRDARFARERARFGEIESQFFFSRIVRWIITSGDKYLLHSRTLFML